MLALRAGSVRRRRDSYSFTTWLSKDVLPYPHVALVFPSHVLDANSLTGVDWQMTRPPDRIFGAEVAHGQLVFLRNGAKPRTTRRRS